MGPKFPIKNAIKKNLEPLVNKEIIVRNSKKGESFEALDSHQYTLEKIIHDTLTDDINALFDVILNLDSLLLSLFSNTLPTSLWTLVML